MSSVGFMARVKGLFGAGPANPATVAAATTVYVPDGLGWVNMTGSATITTLNASISGRGRLVYFYQSDSGTTVFQNTASASTAGQMDLGSGDFTMNATDVLILYLRSNGVWVKVGSSDN